MALLTHEVLQNEPLPPMQENDSLSISQIFKITALTVTATTHGIILASSLTSLLANRRDHTRETASPEEQLLHSLTHLNLEGSTIGLISIMSYISLITLSPDEASVVQAFSIHTGAVSTTVLFVFIAKNRSDIRDPSLHVSTIYVRRNSQDSFVEIDPYENLDQCMICNHFNLLGDAEEIQTDLELLALDTILSSVNQEVPPQTRIPQPIDLNNYNPDDYESNPFVGSFLPPFSDSFLCIDENDDLSSSEKEILELQDDTSNPFSNNNLRH